MGMNRHAVVQAQTSGAIQDIEIGTTGQPEGFFIMASTAQANDTETESAFLMFGCGDGTNFWGTGQGSQGGGIASTISGHASWNDAQSVPACLSLIKPTGFAFDGYCKPAPRANWPTNGIRLEWGANPSLPYRLHVVFIDGDNVKVGTFTRNINIGGSTSVNPGFAADQVCVAGLHALRDGSTFWDNHSFLSLGWADWDGAAIVQGNMWQMEPNNSATTNTTQEVSNNRICNTKTFSGNDDSIELTSMRGGGGQDLVFTSRDQGGNDQVGYMAIKYAAGVAHHMAHVVHPTATGNKDYTADLGGSTAGFALLLHTGVPSVNTPANGATDSELLGVSMISSSVKSCLSYGGGTGQSDVYRKSLSINQAAKVLNMDTDNTPTIAYNGTGTMIADGVRINYSAVTSGTRRGWLVVVEEDAVGSAPDITVGGAIRAIIGIGKTLIGLGIADPEGGTIGMTFGATFGIFTAPDAATAGVTIESGSGTSTMVISGTIAQLEALFAQAAPNGVVYTQTGYDADTITVDAEDSIPNSAATKNIAVTMWTMSLVAENQSDLNQSLLDAEWEHDTAGDFDLDVLATGSGVADSEEDTTTITLTGNTAPIANAGPDLVAPVGIPFVVDGSQSIDPDGNPLTYSWVLTTKPIGSVAQLSATNIEKPTLTPDLLGTYAVELTVNDGQVDSAVDSALYIVTNVVPVRVLIGGIDRTTFIQLPTVEVEKELHARGTARFICFSESTSDAFYLPIVGQSVRIEFNGLPIFGGSIENVRAYQEIGNLEHMFAECDAVSWEQILDRKLVAASFTLQPMEEIVRAIHADHLAQEGITIVEIGNGPTLEKAVWDYETVRQVYDDLAGISGFDHWIDVDKGLHFVQSGSMAAPISIIDGSAYLSGELTQERQDYRNRQLIRAGNDKTEQRVDTVTGDSETRAFTLSFEIGEEPVSIKVNDVAKTFGVKGVEADDTKDFFYQIGSAIINQSDAGTVLSGSDVLEVTYKGLFPLLVVSQKTTEIDIRKAIEGGSGIYEAVEDHEEIDEAAFAFDIATKLLAQKGIIPDRFTFRTLVAGFEPGQLVTINLPRFLLDDDLLIERVAWEELPIDPLAFAYEVQAVSGQALGGWAEFFRALARAGKKFRHRENEVAGPLLLFDEPVTTDESFTVTEDNDPLGVFDVDEWNRCQWA